MKCKLCDLDVYENELCIFHCPKDDWFDIIDGKKDWSKSEGKIAQFWNRIHAKFSVNDTGYREYVFPKFTDSSFFCSNKIKTFKYGASLERTIFLDDAIFNVCDFDDIVFLDTAKFLGKVKFESVTFNRLEASYILLTDSFECLNITFNQKSSINIFISQPIKISMIGIKVAKDLNFTLFDNPIKDVFDANAQRVGYKEHQPVKNPSLTEFSFTGEVNDKVSCKFSLADSKVEQVLISNHNSGLFVCEQFSIQKIFIIDHFINFGKALFANVTTENTEKTVINGSVFGDTFFENVKWGNSPNFKCDRDIFRQLKNAYDKQANYIEANKFYAFEMEAYTKELKEKELKNWREYAECFLFFAGKTISNHGQNWLLALGWILLFSLLMFCLHEGYEFNLDVLINHSEYSFNAQNFWNEFAIFANPFRLDSMGDQKFYLSLLHKIVSGFLIYHFIVALRRNTKR